jgi:hypothetical protein
VFLLICLLLTPLLCAQETASPEPAKETASPEPTKEPPPPAPVFGMVCAKHKDLPKMEIRKFREARRARRNSSSVRS